MFRARFESRCLRLRSVSPYPAIAGQQPGAQEDWAGFPIKWLLIQLAGEAEYVRSSPPYPCPVGLQNLVPSSDTERPGHAPRLHGGTMQWGSGSPVCTLKVPSRPRANAWMLAPVGAGYHGWEGPDSLGVGWGPDHEEGLAGTGQAEAESQEGCKLSTPAGSFGQVNQHPGAIVPTYERGESGPREALHEGGRGKAGWRRQPVPGHLPHQSG